MKTIALLALGLFAGVFASSLSSGCGGCPEQKLLAPGAYVPSDTMAAESDYSLTLSADRKTVTETFTRGGAAYMTIYSATPEQ